MNDCHQNSQITDLNPNILSTPFKIQTNWHVITGAPCCGKTTLITQVSMKGFKTVPEVGREYVEREIARGRTLEEIRNNIIAFDRAIKDLQLGVERRLRAEDELFLDRGFPDSLAYFRLAGLNPNEILPECFQHRYASVFILNRFPTQRDGCRIEDDITADLIDDWLARDYSALGYDVVRIPVLPPEERLVFVLERLSKRDLPGVVVSPLSHQEM